MNRKEKKLAVEALKNDFNSAEAIVVTHYSGLDVAEITKLRRSLTKTGATFKVTKNSLTKLAILDTKYKDMADLFIGPTAVAFSNDDPVAAAKGVVEFAKDNEKLVILGGALDDKVIGVEEVKALAKLPSLDELRAKIVGIISTPATRVAGVLQAPAGQLARVIRAYSQEGEN